MALSEINNGDTGATSRNKINALIDLAIAGTAPPFIQQQGNGLFNFKNSALVTNNWKRIIVVGNSTVSNAADYFREWGRQIGQSNTLSSLPLNPGSTNVAGYTILDAVGNVTVRFNSSTPAGFTVGDLILSAPTGNDPNLNPITGSGVITSIGASSITYQHFENMGVVPMTPPTPGPEILSGGLVTNSIINFGYDGGTVSDIIKNVVPVLGQYARAGDLIVVRGPIINDVRLGQNNLSQLIALVQSLYNAIFAVVPVATDIFWKTENSFLTTDPTGRNAIIPLANSAIYTKTMNEAVLQGLSQISSRSVVWDNMQFVYSKIGQEYATSLWMADEIHPDILGYVREAAAEAQVISGIISGNGFNPMITQNPLRNSTTNGANLSGNPSWIKTLQTMVGFSTYLAEHAQANNYLQPWKQYPDCVLDTERYQIMAFGNLNGDAGLGFIRLDFPTSTVAASQIHTGDLVWIMGEGVFAIPSGFTQTSFNTGGTVFVLQLSGLGSLVPTQVYSGLPASSSPCAILRQLSLNVQDIPYLSDPITFPYRHQITIPDAGVGFIRVQFLDSTPSFPTGMDTTCVISAPAGFLSLAGASFMQISTYTQINLAGDHTAFAGQTGWIFGQPEPENTGSVISGKSIALLGSSSGFVPITVDATSTTLNIAAQVAATGGNGVQTSTVAISALPAAASWQGLRLMVNNANATTFWSIVASGGANVVPVTSDGTNWRIG